MKVVFVLLVIFSLVCQAREPDEIWHIGPKNGYVTILAKWCSYEYRFIVKSNTANILDNPETYKYAVKWIRESSKDAESRGCLNE